MNNKPKYLTVGELRDYLNKSTLSDDSLVIFKEHERKNTIVHKVDKTMMNGKSLLRLIK